MAKKGLNIGSAILAGQTMMDDLKQEAVKEFKKTQQAPKEEIRVEQINVLPELEQLIQPLTQEEFRLLEENLKTDGMRDPIVVWKQPDGRFAIADGHNRWRVVGSNPSVKPIFREMAFEGLEQVKEWMIRNQLGKRNLTKEQKDYLIGLQYEAEKQKDANIQNLKQHRTASAAEGKNAEEAKIAASGNPAAAKGENAEEAKLAASGKTAVAAHSPGGKTEDRVAAENKVSPRSVRNAHQYAKGLDVIGEMAPEVKRQILSGDLKVKKSDIQAVASGKKDAGGLLETLREVSSGSKKPDPAVRELHMPIKQDFPAHELSEKDISRVNAIHGKFSQQITQLLKLGFDKTQIRWMLSQTVKEAGK